MSTIYLHYFIVFSLEVVRIFSSKSVINKITYEAVNLVQLLFAYMFKGLFIELELLLLVLLQLCYACILYLNSDHKNNLEKTNKYRLIDTTFIPGNQI